MVQGSEVAFAGLARSRMRERRAGTVPEITGFTSTAIIPGRKPMARPPRSPDREAIDRARLMLRDAKSADELRIAQAVLLPLEGMLNLKDVAAMVGRSPEWVSKQRNRYIQGLPPLRLRGGRRNALLSAEDEIEAVKLGLAIHQRRFYSDKTLRDDIRDVVESRVGRPIGESTLTGVIRRAAAQLIPEGRAEDLIHIPRAHIYEWRAQFRQRGLLTD